MSKNKHLFRRKTNPKKRWATDFCRVMADAETIVVSKTAEDASKIMFLKIKADMAREVALMTFADFIDDCSDFDQVCSEDDCGQWADDGKNYCELCEKLISDCEKNECRCEDEDHELSEEEFKTAKGIRTIQKGIEPKKEKK